MPDFKEKIFTSKGRSEVLRPLTAKAYDVVVIGGGITGAGIALDAATRGLSTLLVEKRDFASGTSSKSTKLIHGGLRYLKQFEIGLVSETGLERAVVHRNIPHLVHPETMILPIVDGGEFTKFTASMAISVYDFLANVERKDRKKSLTKKQTLALIPQLSHARLKSSIAYSEYRTDDARLTMEIIKAARRYGAEAINYMSVDSFLYDDDRVVGVNCTDATSEKALTFNAKFVVSAAGPWVDELRKKDDSLKGKSLHLTKGVHIVVPREKLNLKHAVYFDAFDGRMIFAIPRGIATYIGTSDTDYSGDLDRVLCTPEDVSYLLEKTNVIFDESHLTPKDVISSWAGLRPLIHEDGKSPSELSRKDEIFESEQGLISIAGGKLTGFRKMSKKIVDLLQKKDKTLPKGKCKTKKMSIHVDSFLHYNEFEAYHQDLAQKYEDVSEYQAWYLSSTYGKNANKIVANALILDGNSFEEKLIKAQVDFCIRFESATYPEDFINRRTGKLYFDIYSVDRNYELILQEFQKHFQWDDKTFKEIDRKTKQLIVDVKV